jgi:hypothetical protein
VAPLDLEAAPALGVVCPALDEAYPVLNREQLGAKIAPTSSGDSSRTPSDFVIAIDELPEKNPTYDIGESGPALQVPADWGDAVSVTPTPSEASLREEDDDMFPIHKDLSGVSGKHSSEFDSISTTVASSSTQSPRSSTTRDFSESSHDIELPKVWTRMVSKSTGKTYFHNRVTGESSVVEPANMLEVMEMPPGWKQMRSRRTGKAFYWNSATKISQFEFPKA